MTGETGKLASLVTGRFEQSVVLPTGDANHAVRPEEIAQQVWIPGQIIRETGDFLHARRTNDGGGGFQIVTRAKAKPVVAPVFVAVPPFHRMTEATDLPCPSGVDLFRMDDFAPQNCRLGRRCLVALSQPGIGVALSGPVAGFTGNPQLRSPGVHRASRAVHAGFGPRRMTPAADHVPDLGPVHDVWRAHEGRVAWHPALFGN